MFNIQVKKMLNGSIGKMPLDINLKINKGDFIALTGASGSGKTTLLRILAGFEKIDNGFITVNDSTWVNSSNKKKFIPTQKREIGYLFQDYALFPNMTVLKNLLFVKKDIKLANKLLKMVDLKFLENQLPEKLSGGQKQRVALCRALMGKPKLLLLDEPLSALDLNMRKKLQDDILRFHEEFNITTIMVSHEPSEIYKLSSKVVLLEHGKILKHGLAKKVLLKTSGSQKFAFEGEILEIYSADILDIAIVSIGSQLVKVVLDSSQANELKVGDNVTISTKAFLPTISKVKMTF